MRMTYLRFSFTRASGFGSPGLAHAFGVVDVVAEDDGLLERVGRLAGTRDLLGHALRALSSTSWRSMSRWL
jgi:hypothetical protein